MNPSNKQLPRILERRERQLSALRRISEGLASVSGETLIGQALDVVFHTLEARSGAVLLYDAPADELVFRCVLGPCAETLSGRRVAASQGIAGQVLRTGQPEITRHAAEDEFLLVRCDEEKNSSTHQTVFTLPLPRASGDVLGVMQFLWTIADKARDEAAELDAGDMEVVRVLGAGIVSALERARLAGQEQRAEVVSIIGDISHDIKNMLTPIQSGLWTLEPMLDQLFIELDKLREQAQGRAMQQQLSSIMELVQNDYSWILQNSLGACDQVTARTREIADAVKGEMAPPIFEMGDINAIVSEVARPLFMLADLTNVHLHLELDHDLPRCECDRKQIYNAIYNLVNNAIPETPSGGSVTIRTCAPAKGEEMLCIEVEDTGRGVPEHVRETLFTDCAVSTKAGGTGLGTRIVGGVVRRHQGRITVQSEIGQGSTFSLYLPLHQRPGGALQTVAPGALPVRRHNLPTPSTSFVGRGSERARIREMMQVGGARLLTLTGMGGTGKTRLALRVAMDMVDEFADGVWLVSLAPIDSTERVVAAIAATLGVREASGRALQESLSDYLRTKQLLLLLDNFEQVLAAAHFVATLLEECANLKILVTSRTRLNLRGERELPLSPLSLPPAAFPRHPTPARIRELVGYEAVTLFLERALQAQPEFALTSENARDVALLCRRLDGLPLAIELAAARTKMLSPQAIRTHLETRMTLPGAGPQDAPRRHQTLRAAIDWSYDLLSPAEQSLLRRLMVFEGGATGEAVRAVIDTAALGLEVGEALEKLCEQSLLRHSEQSDGSIWFYALETLRAYGREKMQQTGEWDVLRRRHAHYYLTIAEAARALLSQDPDAPPAPPGLPDGDAPRAVWNQWRAREYEDLRAALAWFLEHNGDEGEDAIAHGALRMALALREVWLGNLWTERREALELALEANPNAPVQQRLYATLFTGDLATLQGDLARAEACAHSSLQLSHAANNRWGEARALGILGRCALERGDCARAQSLYQQSLEIHREMGNFASIAWTLYFLGTVAKGEGDNSAAQDYFQHSLDDFRELQDREGVAFSLYQLGMATYQPQSPAPARALIAESLEIFRELQQQSGMAWVVGFMGKMALAEGDFTAARSYLEQSLETWRRLGSRLDIRAMLQALGEVALAEGDWESALILLRELLDDDATALAPELLPGLIAVALARGQMERAACLLGALQQSVPNSANLPAVSTAAETIRDNLDAAVFAAHKGRGTTLTPAELAAEVLAL